jgi:hypothetical protein
MDGNGNYYTVNGKDQLVVAKDKDEASVFTFVEANQRIGGGKKAKFYHTIPVDEQERLEPEFSVQCAENDGESITEDSTEDHVIFHIVDKIGIGQPQQDETESSRASDICQPIFEYNIEQVNWKEFVYYYIYLSTGTKKYQERLAKQHSDVEKGICDLLHYVELYDLTDEEGLRAMDMLKDARQRRRDIKDELSTIEFFQKMVGTGTNVSKARRFLEEIKKLDKRRYSPRKLKDLFEGMENKKTDRALYRQNREMMNNVWEEDVDHIDVEEQQMDFCETVFDNQENDWLGFARQQMEFYQNVGQYMVNLQTTIDTINEEIESVMKKIEKANYNVTQGYKVFKELKDLRNEQKEKAHELAVLRIMTERFDIEAMEDAFADEVEAIEKLTDCTVTEEIEQ